MENVVIASRSQYLENSGTDLILQECEKLGTRFVRHNLSGSHYIKGIRGIVILAEAIVRLLLTTEFLTNQNPGQVAAD